MSVLLLAASAAYSYFCSIKQPAFNCNHLLLLSVYSLCLPLLLAGAVVWTMPCQPHGKCLCCLSSTLSSSVVCGLHFQQGHCIIIMIYTLIHTDTWWWLPCTHRRTHMPMLRPHGYLFLMPFPLTERIVVNLIFSNVLPPIPRHEYIYMRTDRQTDTHITSELPTSLHSFVPPRGCNMSLSSSLMAWFAKVHFNLLHFISSILSLSLSMMPEIHVSFRYRLLVVSTRTPTCLPLQLWRIKNAIFSLHSTREKISVNGSVSNVMTATNYPTHQDEQCIELEQAGSKKPNTDRIWEIQGIPRFQTKENVFYFIAVKRKLQQQRQHIWRKWVIHGEWSRICIIQRQANEKNENVIILKSYGRSVAVYEWNSLKKREHSHTNWFCIEMSRVRGMGMLTF